MGLWSFLTGVDTDEEQKRGDQLDAQLAALNQKDYAPGGAIYNKIVQDEGVEKANETYDQVNQNLAETKTGNVNEQVEEAFGEGLKEGYDRTTGAIKAGLAAPFKFTFASIPWQIYVAGAVVLFFYMGGGVWLARVLKGRLK